MLTPDAVTQAGNRKSAAIKRFRRPPKAAQEAAPGNVLSHDAIQIGMKQNGLHAIRDAHAVSFH
jgi:hypothetical protein